MSLIDPKCPLSGHASGPTHTWPPPFPWLRQVHAITADRRGGFSPSCASPAKSAQHELDQALQECRIGQPLMTRNGRETILRPFVTQVVRCVPSLVVSDICNKWQPLGNPAFRDISVFSAKPKQRRRWRYPSFGSGLTASPRPESRGWRCRHDHRRRSMKYFLGEWAPTRVPNLGGSYRQRRRRQTSTTDRSPSRQ